MRLFLLSILAIGGVHSLTIGYPYRSALLAYSPGRGEFPVQSSEVQGYLRYFDNNGVEHLVSYSHPEPTLGVRQVAGMGGPVVRAYNIDLATYSKAIEGHFRAWIAVQYKAINDEINALKAQGKQPSADLLLRLQPLEKIYQTADFSTIAELPEVKRLFDEHSRIYKVKTEFLQKPTGELKTYTAGTYAALVPVQETPEQKQAREEHLRTYNQQVENLRQLETQREVANKESFFKSNIDQTKTEEQQPINRLAAASDGITEVERATQEHLRLWNEAKLRTEKSISQQQFRVWVIEQYKILKNDIDALRAQGSQPSGELLVRLQLLEKIYQTQDYSTISELPEVNRLYDEFYSIYKVKLEIQHEPQGETKTYYSTMYVPQLAVEETPEQKRAREEHLRIHTEQVAYLRKLEAQREETTKEASLKSQSDQTKFVQQDQTKTADGITEVERATQEHLRLWNEARLRTEETLYQQQFRVWIKNEIDAFKLQGKELPVEKLTRLQLLERIYQTPNYSTIAELPEVKRLYEEFVRIYRAKIEINQASKGEANTPYVPLQPVEETPEQKRAREEHLRIHSEQVEHLRKLEAQLEQTLNESSAKFQKDQKKPTEMESTKPTEGITEVERATQEHLRLWNEAKLNAEKTNYHSEDDVSQSSIKQANPEVVNAVAEPAEILKARAEHLRLVNEATLRIQNANSLERQSQIVQVGQQPDIQLKSIVPTQQEQQQTQQHGVIDTPEVQRAREEHLRLVNEAKIRAQSVEQEEFNYKKIDDKPILTNIHASSESIQQTTIPVETPEVIKAREEHLRLVSQAAQQNIQPLAQSQNINQDQIQVAETPEVIKARQEHLRIFNEIKSQADQEQAKIFELKASGIQLKSHHTIEDSAKLQEQQLLNEEARILELERIREATRLLEEQRLLEIEQAREAERLAEEQRQMEAELVRMKLEEEQRLETEKLIESRRLKEEQEQAQQIIITEEYKPIEGQTQQAMYINNPFLNNFFGKKQEPISQVALLQSNDPKIKYTNNPFLNAATISSSEIQSSWQQPKPYIPLQQVPIVFPSDARKIQSSQNSIGTKQQHIKQDYIKGTSFDHASFQPADTAAVLIHLEKARQDHFRAHDQALEQLRLARVKNASLKDCN